LQRDMELMRKRVGQDGRAPGQQDNGQPSHPL
jgi:hypothetical protein